MYFALLCCVTVKQQSSEWMEEKERVARTHNKNFYADALLSVRKRLDTVDEGMGVVMQWRKLTSRFSVR